MNNPPTDVAPLAPESHNLPIALLAGAAAAAIGAALWALITVFSGMQIGWMAIGIGFLVGYAVRYFGKGSDPSFQILGAVLSLAGCLAGNLLAACIFASQQQHLPLTGFLLHLTPSLAVRLIVDTFSGMDLLFYGIAVYEGYKFSRVPGASAPAADLSA